MKLSNMYLLIILFFTCTALDLNANSTAVTYTLAGGRLGDQLLAYLHAKWISYKYNIPLFYVPFPYSDKLVLDDVENNYSSTVAESYPDKRTLGLKQSLEDLMHNASNKTLFIIPYFPESLEEYMPGSFMAQHNPFPYFQVNWNDQVFHTLIQGLIKLKQNLSLVIPPKDCLSIAIHVRKNSGGFDLPLLHGRKPEEVDPNQLYVDVAMPFKHPPETYYIEQIKRILSMFPENNAYIYIFTDDPNPVNIYNNFRQAIPDSHVHFDYRKTENNHYSNVLEDMFSMMNFDCLIRPDSNLSIVASKVGDYKVVISPAHNYWVGTNLIIDEVVVKLQNQTAFIAKKE